MRRGPWRIVILVRRIDAAAALSVLLHLLLLFLLPGPKPLPPVPPGQAPMQVVLAPPEPVKAPPVPEATTEPIQRPTVRPVPKPSAPRAPQPTPRPLPEPAADAPAPTPAPTPTTPPVDMLAMIEARRAARRSSEGRGGGTQGPPAEDAATRNLRTLTGGEGVGGVFEILRKGVRTGQFAFNGFKPDARSKWREVIEVDAGAGGDIELAMVRRMIELIRQHYSGDFRWDSHRLGRVVTLSARPEDQPGLEDFMMKEFFSTPGRG